MHRPVPVAAARVPARTISTPWVYSRRASQEWFFSVPLITRTYVTGAIVVTASCSLELVSPFSLYFNLKLVLFKLQVWRLFTNFFFFGSLGIDFLFHMFFLARCTRSFSRSVLSSQPLLLSPFRRMRARTLARAADRACRLLPSRARADCRLLEEEYFRGRTADFALMLSFGGTLMCLASTVISAPPFLGSSLAFMMVYVWARQNKETRMSFLGLFTFKAPFLPWVLLVRALGAAATAHNKRMPPDASLSACCAYTGLLGAARQLSVRRFDGHCRRPPLLFPRRDLPNAQPQDHPGARQSTLARAAVAARGD